MHNPSGKWQTDHDLAKVGSVHHTTCCSTTWPITAPAHCWLAMVMDKVYWQWRPLDHWTTPLHISTCQPPSTDWTNCANHLVQPAPVHSKGMFYKLFHELFLKHFIFIPPSYLHNNFEASVPFQMWITHYSSLQYISFYNNAVMPIHSDHEHFLVVHLGEKNCS